jgi:hypothetical protein
VAPETIVATKFVSDTPPAVRMTRPLCVFPEVAKYRRSGNTSIAANFTCVADEPDFNQTPARSSGREECDAGEPLLAGASPFLRRRRSARNQMIIAIRAQISQS